MTCKTCTTQQQIQSHVHKNLHLLEGALPQSQLNLQQKVAYYAMQFFHWTYILSPLATGIAYFCALDTFKNILLLEKHHSKNFHKFIYLFIHGQLPAETSSQAPEPPPEEKDAKGDKSDTSISSQTHGIVDSGRLEDLFAADELPPARDSDEKEGKGDESDASICSQTPGEVDLSEAESEEGIPLEVGSPPIQSESEIVNKARAYFLEMRLTEVQIEEFRNIAVTFLSRKITTLDKEAWNQQFKKAIAPFYLKENFKERIDSILSKLMQLCGYEDPAEFKTSTFSLRHKSTDTDITFSPWAELAILIEEKDKQNLVDGMQLLADPETDIYKSVINVLPAKYFQE